jgi:Spy/CpxP family protein refolding chaperone
MSLSHVLRRSLLLFVLPLVVAASTAGAQDPAPEKPAAPAAKSARPFRGRLPNFWSKIGLTEQQKQRIYAHQLEVRPKLEELERQLEAVRAELREKMEKELSDSQKQELAQYEAEDAKKQTAAAESTTAPESPGSKESAAKD